MMYGLRCNNGKEIDMTHYVLKQIQGEITREELQERIEYYKTTNYEYNPNVYYRKPTVPRYKLLRSH